MNNTPQRYGKIIDDKYVWKHADILPNYTKNGEDIISQYNPYDEPGKYNYFMGDSKEKFLINSKKIEDWHYNSKNVDYTINSKGFRSKEFEDINWKESILLFGCSCVYGVGVSDDETLSYYLSKLLNRDVINLGVPGGSNIQIISNSLIFRKKYGIPYGVIIMWTGMDRFLYYNNNSFHHVGPWDSVDVPEFKDFNDPDYKKLYEEYYFSRTNEIMNAKITSQIGKEIWKNKTRYFDGSFFEDVAHFTESNQFFPFSNTARDLLHPGHVDYYRTAIEIVNTKKF